MNLLTILFLLGGTFIIYNLFLPSKTYTTFRESSKAKLDYKKLDSIPVTKVKKKITSIGYADEAKRLAYAKKHKIKTDEKGRLKNQDNKSESDTKNN